MQTAFQGMDGLKNASLEQLQEIKGLGSKAATALHSCYEEKHSPNSEQQDDQ